VPESHSQIRVLIVDDSAFMRAALSRMVASDPQLWVVGTASSGHEALQRIPALDPDVITLDVRMPGLDGLQTLKRIMADHPRPVIMVSAVTEKDAEITLDALAAGAFDCVAKELPAASLDIDHLRDNVISKIKGAAESSPMVRAHQPARKPSRAATLPSANIASGSPTIVAIGISTGGPKALQDILPSLPADLSVPVIVVQHMPPGFTKPFAGRLNGLCAVSVCEAIQSQRIEPGVVYIAPAGVHLTVEHANSRTVICLSEKPDDQPHIPSIDVMMQSVASTFHSLAMGVIMTGMGSDGAQGMAAIHREGGLTIGQDEQSCAVYGMPRVCAEMGVLNRVVPLSQIPGEIVRATQLRRATAG
jgi:two-component system, chemotaxis family, protein-glutamate methylesterase/glutaminase